MLAAQPEKAMKAYEKAHAWRELFALGLQHEMSKSVLSGMSERVTGKWRSHRMLELRRNV